MSMPIRMIERRRDVAWNRRTNLARLEKRIKHEPRIGQRIRRIALPRLHRPRVPRPRPPDIGLVDVVVPAVRVAEAVLGAEVRPGRVRDGAVEEADGGVGELGRDGRVAGELGHDGEAFFELVVCLVFWVGGM